MAIPDNQIQCQLEKFMSGVQPAHIERTKKLSEESLNQFLLLAINEKIGEELRQIFYQDFFPPTEDQLEKGKKKLEKLIVKLSSEVKTPEKNTSKIIETFEMPVCDGCGEPIGNIGKSFCRSCGLRLRTESDPDIEDEEVICKTCICGEIQDYRYCFCAACGRATENAKTERIKKGLLWGEKKVEVDIQKKNGEIENTLTQNCKCNNLFEDNLNKRFDKLQDFLIDYMDKRFTEVQESLLEVKTLSVSSELKTDIEELKSIILDYNKEHITAIKNIEDKFLKILKDLVSVKPKKSAATTKIISDNKD